MGQEQEEGLLGRVQKWANETGYTLEMIANQRFYRKLSSIGWYPNPGFHYHEIGGTNLREVDLFVDRAKEAHGVGVWFVLAAECKATKNPWIIFKVMEEEYAPARPLFSPAGGFVEFSTDPPDGFESQVSKFSRVLERHSQGYPSPGYMIAEAFKAKNERDNSYTAVSQAASAALASITSSNLSFTLSEAAFGICTPVVITTSRLFEASLNERDEIQLTEVSRSSVSHYQHPSGGGQPNLTVTIVNAEAIDTLISDCLATEAAAEEFFRLQRSQEPTD